MCDEGCATCYNLTYCALCDEQRSYAKNISTDECVICSGDHFILNDTCYSCSENCHSCLSASECQNCDVGFYIDENKACSECQEHCLHCENYTHCTECNESNGYARNDLTGDCIICGEGNFISNHSCLSCTENCLECDNSE